MKIPARFSSLAVAVAAALLALAPLAKAGLN